MKWNTGITSTLTKKQNNSSKRYKPLCPEQQRMQKLLEMQKYVF